jgi:multidrug transporter EmrE-like cation transporter
VDHHTLAAISIAGSCLDVLGSLYLAYDLLGGQYGPLRLLTRAVTYSILFGVGYGVGLGPFFGVASGVAVGVTIAIELNRISRGGEYHSLTWAGVFSSIRSLGVAIGLYPIVGIEFATLFAIAIAAGQVYAYSRGIRPGMDYTSALHARLTRRQVWGTIVRTVGYFLTALVCSIVIHHVNWVFAIRVGIVTGIVTGIGQTVTPYIEYYANNMPQRLMGVFGIGLILCGFALQSMQYWLALFDVRLS